MKTEKTPNTKEPVYCIYNTQIHDPHKDYGTCHNKNSSNYGKPVFRHECEIVLPCYGKKRQDEAVYIASMLAPDELTAIVSEGMLNILKYPKDKRVREWKHGIALRLKMLLLRVSKEREERRGKEIVTSVHHHADRFFNTLNKDGSLSAYSMEEYQIGKAIHWRLLLEGKEIANTER